MCMVRRRLNYDSLTWLVDTIASSWRHLTFSFGTEFFCEADVVSLSKLVVITREADCAQTPLNRIMADNPLDIRSYLERRVSAIMVGTINATMRTPRQPDRAGPLVAA